MAYLNGAAVTTSVDLVQRMSKSPNSWVAATDSRSPLNPPAGRHNRAAGRLFAAPTVAAAIRRAQLRAHLLRGQLGIAMRMACTVASALSH